MTDYRPLNKTLLKVIQHLNELGLYVYGQGVDLETGEISDGLMDYTAEDVIKFRHLLETDQLTDKRV